MRLQGETFEDAVFRLLNEIQGEQDAQRSLLEDVFEKLQDLNDNDIEEFEFTEPN